MHLRRRRYTRPCSCRLLNGIRKKVKMQHGNYFKIICLKFMHLVIFQLKTDVVMNVRVPPLDANTEFLRTKIQENIR